MSPIYAEDSFFTLTAGGRVGLFVLSILLAGLVFAAAAFLFRRLRFASLPARLFARAGVALLLLYLFEWLSPQVYYLYYQLIFDGLAWQIVVKSPPGVQTIAELLSFTARTTLSHHARGLLGWALVLYALVPPIWTLVRR